MDGTFFQKNVVLALDILKYVRYSLIDGSKNTQFTVNAPGGSGSEACLGASPADVLTLYQQILPPEFFDPLDEKAGRRRNNRVYTDDVVIWLMSSQRMQGHGTLESGVLELLRGLPDSFWPKPCKRLRVGADGKKPTLSANTGSYNDARQGLPVETVEQALDHSFEQLLEQARGVLQTAGRRAFFFDGTTVRTPHSEALCQAYPPGSNQHGEGHWPLLRMLVAHDLDTGLALRAVWGPLNGPQAVSEQALLEQALDRLPEGALLLGDSNFGVFSVAYAATQKDHPVLLRLTETRACYLAQGPLRDGIDRRITWKPSRWDRPNHPQLPPEACVSGRLIVREVQPSDGSQPFLLALFTTLEDAVDQLIPLYGKRWNIETDLRTLKGSLHLEQLTCTSPSMVAKEIDTALLAYNLVRAITCLAAERAGLNVRAFSFTRVRRIIYAFAPLIAHAKHAEEGRELFEKMLYYVGQAKLYKRKRRSYPRAVWGRPQVYPKRKAKA